jgi:3'-phosphoadenosine 5'-phosphosulfate sulfotransferase (PAPS reductase)/FAD synthetase
MSAYVRPVVDRGQRVVVWFSCGAASAVAAKLTLAEYGHERVQIVYTDPGSEHPDNVRFRGDCVRWFNHPIEVLKNPKYEDTWQLWQERRFLVGPKGALCTTELKKRLRQKFEDFDDIQVFGFTSEEKVRADRFREQNPEVMLATPLIEEGLNKSDTIAMIERAGITVPTMYLMGYQNNNCIGCVKGGMGYWNKIRRDFPEVFARMARLERELGATVNRDDDKPLYLDELDPTRGRYEDEPSFECSLLCAITESKLEAAE